MAFPVGLEGPTRKGKPVTLGGSFPSLGSLYSLAPRARETSTSGKCLPTAPAVSRPLYHCAKHFVRVTPSTPLSWRTVAASSRVASVLCSTLATSTSPDQIITAGETLPSLVHKEDTVKDWQEDPHYQILD